MRAVLALTLLIFTVLFAGCGGSGYKPEMATPVIGTPYGGNFRTSSGETGTYGLSLTSDGTLFGTAQNDTTGVPETVSGYIRPNGTALLAFTTPTSKTVASGTLTLSSPGHYSGTLVFASGETIAISLDKVPVDPPA